DPEFHMARPAQVDNYRGFWFVNLSKGGDDLKTHLGEAAAAFDQLIDRAPGKETEIVGDCFRMVQQSNWKIFLENQLDASHPGVTHESTGKAAQKLEAKIRQEGEEPPMELSFLSDFARLGHDGWTKFGTVGYRNGHSSLEGYMGLRPDDPDTNEYVRRMHEAYGEKKAEEILGTNIHHMLVYPCNSVQPPLQQLRTIRPLAHDKTLTEIWHFRLKNAPEKIYRRSLAYYYMVNSPSTLINADDLFNWWKCQHGLDSSASEWVSFHRKAGQDEERDGVSYSAPESMSELPLRHMMHAWREYMTATVGEKL
ncbi:MAG: SRPBCC family protein, partial [Pseudomonadota bacterium]|nr:SRPBCC family protein [Pseudomonadota bacterium]